MCIAQVLASVSDERGGTASRRPVLRGRAWQRRSASARRTLPRVRILCTYAPCILCCADSPSCSLDSNAPVGCQVSKLGYSNGGRYGHSHDRERSRVLCTPIFINHKPDKPSFAGLTGMQKQYSECLRHHEAWAYSAPLCDALGDCLPLWLRQVNSPPLDDICVMGVAPCAVLLARVVYFRRGATCGM
jgi:hypothetical protein